MTDQAGSGCPRLSDIEPFSGLPADVLDALETEAEWFRVDAGHRLIDAGVRAPHGVFVLAEGALSVERAAPGGQPIPLGRLSAPCCVGEFAALDGLWGSASVTAATPCVLAEIPADRFRQLLRDHPPLSLFVLEKAVSIVRRLGEDIVRLRRLEHEDDEFYRRALIWCL